MKKYWTIKKNGEINQKEIFNSEKKANDKRWLLKPKNIDVAFEVVEVREFHIWFRIHDEKDSIPFYSDAPNLEDAIDEAIKSLKGAFAIEYDGEIVARHGVNYVRNPEKRR